VLQPDFRHVRETRIAKQLGGKITREWLDDGCGSSSSCHHSTAQAGA